MGKGIGIKCRSTTKVFNIFKSFSLFYACNSETIPKLKLVKGNIVHFSNQFQKTVVRWSQIWDCDGFNIGEGVWDAPFRHPFITNFIRFGFFSSKRSQKYAAFQKVYFSGRFCLLPENFWRCWGSMNDTLLFYECRLSGVDIRSLPAVIKFVSTFCARRW